MPAQDQQNTHTEIRIDGQLIEQVDAICPRYMPRTVFINQALDSYLKGLDTVCYPLGKQPEPLAGEQHIFQSQEIKRLRTEEINLPKPRAAKVNKERARDSSRTRTDYSDEFNEFWGVYQSSPSKANSQSKVKAWEEWKMVIKTETPERLTEAAQKAIDEVKQLRAADEFCAPLPDCFRWLRDGRYVVLLEGHTVTPTQKRPEFKHPAHQVFTAADFN